MQRHDDNLAARINGNALQPLQGASVTVTDDATGLPASLYSDDGVTPLAQPVITGNEGEYGFYAPNGEYTMTFSGVRFATFTRKLIMADPSDNPYTTQASLAAPTGAAGVGWQNGDTAITTARALDILYHGVANVRNPKYAGGALGGGNDDTAAFRAAIASGAKIVYAPADTYGCDTLTLPIDVSLIGDGMRQTIIESKAIGASLIRTVAPDGVQVGCIRDLQLLGNGLTGAAGNGHAINFIDPALGTGAYTPQGMTVERVWIKKFRGDDVRDNGTTLKIAAAGVICVEGLQNVYRDVLVHECGNGFYLERTQTNKLDNCVAYLCDKAGVLTYQSVATVIERCDFVGNGASGTTDAGYPRSDLGTGNLISYMDEGMVISRNKVKNTSGQAQIYLVNSYGAIVSENWIRSDIDSARAIVVNFGIKALKCSGIKIRDNTFTCVLAAGTDASLVKAKHVNLVTDSVAETFNAVITGNLFPTQPGLRTEFNICIESIGSTACLFANVDVEWNRFGTPLVVGTATVTDADILVRNCGFTHSKIRNNTHYAQTNVTRTLCISGTGLTAESSNNIGQNLFKTDGGVITTKHNGFLYPTLRLASGTFDPPNLAAGASTTTTLAVANALMGEPVQVYFSNALQGVILTAWVSAPGTVTVQMYNPTAAPIDLLSGSLGVIVGRTSMAEVS